MRARRTPSGADRDRPRGGEPAERILDAIGDPIVVLDRGGRVLHRNRAARRRLAAVAPGRPLLPPGSPESERLSADLARCGASPRPVADGLELGSQRFRCRGAGIARGPGADPCILLHLVPEAETGPAHDRPDAAGRREQASRERDQVLIRIYRANQEERLRLARDLHDQS